MLSSFNAKNCSVAIVGVHMPHKCYRIRPRPFALVASTAHKDTWLWQPVVFVATWAQHTLFVCRLKYGPLRSGHGSALTRGENGVKALSTEHPEVADGEGAAVVLVRS